MIIAFIKRRKIPKVIMVIGNVKIIKIGLTISRNKAKTMATISAEPYPATWMPGSISASTNTATPVRSSFKMSLIIGLFLWKY